MPLALGVADANYAVAFGALLASLVLVPIGIGWVLETAERQSAQLDALARRDALTGVGNRRALLQLLAYEVPRHARLGTQFSVLALDLTGFKEINDQHGHHVGDRALIDVAEALGAATRTVDTVARTGGDEFVVVLPETDHAGAAQAASSVRRALARVQTPNGPVASGIGIASFPQDGVDPELLLASADVELLQDKATRSRSTVA